MANVFRLTTKASVSASSGSPTTIYTAPSSKSAVILSLLLTNKHTTAVKVTVLISSDTATGVNTGAAATNADIYVLKDVILGDETSLELLSGQKYILQTTDILKVYADNANIDVALSYMEQDV